VSVKKTKSFVLACAVLLTFGRQAHAQPENRIKEFIVMGYEGIISNLRSGDGPYLETLAELLKAPPEQRAKIIEQVRSLSQTYPNILDFAEHVGRIQLTTAVTFPSGSNVYSGEQLDNALSHMTRGMKITVFSKGGAQLSGQFDEYTVHRLWINGASHTSFHLDDILAIQAPQL
jgi:hypothetical protein